MNLEDYRRKMEMCSRCSLCKFIPLEKITDAEYAYACPSIAKHNFHAYSGGGRLNVGLAMLEGRVDPGPKVSEIVYDCMMCGACDVSCKYAMDMEVLEPLAETRAACVENGQTVPALDGLVQRLREESVMLAGPRSRRRLGARDLDVKDCTRESAQVVYHLGCRIAHDESLWRIPRATVALLKHAGVDVGVLGDSEACCGGLALELGYKADFLAQVNRCNAVLEGTGAGILVTNCAHCFQAFTVPYAKAGKQPPLRVMHVVQLLQELVDTGKLELGAVAPAKVTYHDPCHLGRLGEPCVPWSGTPTPGHRRMFDPPKEWRRGTRGVYGPPRGLLAEMPGVELVEMSRAKEYAWCCGGGGGVPESDPDFAAWTARERLAEAQATGAEAIITACPGCKRSLEDAAKETGAAIRVLDVVELLTSAG